MTKSVCNYGDPACLVHFAPGHISNPTVKKKKDMTALASTYLCYSPDGKELLMNISGEHVYLFDTTFFTESLKYDFNKDVSDDVPTLRSYRHASTHNPLHGATPSGYHVTCSASHATSVDENSEVLRLKEEMVYLIKRKQYTTVIDMLSGALRRFPKCHELYNFRAEALFIRKWWGSEISEYLVFYLSVLAVNFDCSGCKINQFIKVLCINYIIIVWPHPLYRDGDCYAALRDVESALSLSPSSRKAHRLQLKLLFHLGYSQEGTRLFQYYRQQYPNDKSFISKFKTDLEQSQDSGGWGLWTDVGVVRKILSLSYIHVHVRSHISHTHTHMQPHTPLTSISLTIHTASVHIDKKHLTQWEVKRQAGAYDYKHRYCGHCNTHTDIKEASFIGEGCGFIAAGSDDGNIFMWVIIVCVWCVCVCVCDVWTSFIFSKMFTLEHMILLYQHAHTYTHTHTNMFSWEKDSSRLVRVLHGDDSIVNCVQWHPTGPLLATSGIESVVRLWEPRPHTDQESRWARNNVDNFTQYKI